MAAILGAFGAALGAAKGGMSANEFYRSLQAAGFGARRSEALSLFKIAKSITTAAPEEPFRNPQAIPAGNELQPWPTKEATGIVQNITLTYRDRTTGAQKTTYYRVKSDTGITREAAVAQAIDAYSDHAEAYNQDLIGAVHTSAYSLIPGMV